VLVEVIGEHGWGLVLRVVFPLRRDWPLSETWLSHPSLAG
jgi:hypothetical protein